MEEHDADRVTRVPGHEIVGRVVKLGPAVEKFRGETWSRWGAWWPPAASARTARRVKSSTDEHFATFTYNGQDKISGGVTYGGYSDSIVVDERFVSPRPEGARPGRCRARCSARASPRTRPSVAWEAGSGKKVGVVGLGGLGTWS